MAVDSLLPLGVAFAVLATTYLAVQYMLALKRTWFLVPLALVALAEPILLLHASHKPADFAAVVLAVQVVAAVVAFTFALWPERSPARPSPSSSSRRSSASSREVLGDTLSSRPQPAEVGGPAER